MKKLSKPMAMLLTLILLAMPPLAAFAEDMRPPVLIAEPEVMGTTGPNGEDPTWYDQIVLTEEEVEAVRAMNLSAAIEGSNESEWITAQFNGFRDAAEALNITIAAETTCEVDPSRQKENMETFLALDVDAVISQAQEVDMAAASYDALVENGVGLIFTSNVPTGYTAGEEYISCVTDELYSSGALAADLLAEEMGGEGQVIAIVSSAVSYVVNTRDNAFLETMETKYPDIEVVAVGGFEAITDAGTTASGLLTRYPEATGIYVSYPSPANDVLEVIRGLGRSDIKLITLDLDVVIALDMIEGGNTIGIIADMPYTIGYVQGMLIGYHALGKEAPAFIASPSFTVTMDNIEDAWLQGNGEELPEQLQEALNS